MGKKSGNLKGLALAACLGGLFLGACSSMVHTDGVVLDDTKVGSIQPGVQSEDDIKRLIGTPSSQSIYGEKTWYYITRRTSRVAFFDPSVQEQKVIAITFDDSGKVSGVRQYGLNDSQDVSPVARTTPTKGKHLTFLDQMMGNLNRYGPSAGSRPGGGGPGGGGPGGGGSH
jgi:outer membrane protein assembly factor BamE (lipoprotein component of BamABCDE complex)